MGLKLQVGSLPNPRNVRSVLKRLLEHYLVGNSPKEAIQLGFPTLATEHTGRQIRHWVSVRSDNRDIILIPVHLPRMKQGDKLLRRGVKRFGFVVLKVVAGLTREHQIVCDRLTSSADRLNMVNY